MGWLNNPSHNDTILRTIHDLIYLLSQILMVNQPANKTPVHRYRASSQLGPNKVSSTMHLCIMYGLPQVQEPWTKSFAIISQSKDFYLISRLSQAFCRSNGNLLTYLYELFYILSLCFDGLDTSFQERHGLSYITYSFTLEILCGWLVVIFWGHSFFSELCRCCFISF